jgi:hypothetical protein
MRQTSGEIDIVVVVKEMDIYLQVVEIRKLLTHVLLEVFSTN